MRPDIKDQAQGRWRGILGGLGMASKMLSGKHGPCPICDDGNDRFRFDDKDGKGSFICSKCGAGNGVDLVMQWKHVDFLGAKELIEGQIGSAPLEAPKAGRDEAREKANMTSLWRRASPLDGQDIVSRYLKGRGVAMASWPASVRWIAELAYSEDGETTLHPGMLAKYVAHDDSSAILHRIFLREPGAHADVNRPKMFMPGKVPPGGAVRTGPVEETMGIGEGLVNSLSAGLQHRLTVWAALDAGNLMKWIPPKGSKHIVIFGDLDSSFTGQMAAYNLAFRLKNMKLNPEDKGSGEKYTAEVRFTQFTDNGQIDEDWNDMREAA